jgi:tRNA(adenine34) deaminase
MPFDDQDRRRMERALEQAADAGSRGEVPVGAVLALGDKIIAQAGNSPITVCDPTAHAEMTVIRDASQKLGNYRLGGTLYVTLEPCLMCMGAIIHSRIERLVFGAYDPKTGAACSIYQIGSDRKLNHTLIIEGGLLEDRCGQILRKFFRERRSAAQP